MWQICGSNIVLFLQLSVVVVQGTACGNKWTTQISTRSPLSLILFGAKILNLGAGAGTVVNQPGVEDKWRERVDEGERSGSHFQVKYEYDSILTKPIFLAIQLRPRIRGGGSPEQVPERGQLELAWVGSGDGRCAPPMREKETRALNSTIGVFWSRVPATKGEGSRGFLGCGQ